MLKITVNTPKGVKYHGKIVDGWFVREVKEKDRMRIYDAWSIHPEVLEQIKDQVKGLRYFQIHSRMEYRITIDKVLECGFEKEFAGGKTVYIELKHWDVINPNQRKLL